MENQNSMALANENAMEMQMAVGSGLSTGAKCGISAAIGVVVGVVGKIAFDKIFGKPQVIPPAPFDKGQFEAPNSPENK